MPFVKLDCGILNSTLWFERTQREVFLTALLMAEPLETDKPLPQIAATSLDLTGWIVPPGWYGFVPAASVGILHRAGITDAEAGLIALASLGEPEAASRSKDFEGRRLVRVDGGFIVLNYFKYRDRDYTTAERSKRYRERLASRRDDTKSHRDITQAEAEAEAEAEERSKNGVTREDLALITPPVVIQTDRQIAFGVFWSAYPKKAGKGAAEKVWNKIKPDRQLIALMMDAIAKQSKSEQWQKSDGQFIPNPATWLNQGRWQDELKPANGRSTLDPRTLANLEAAERFANRKRLS